MNHHNYYVYILTNKNKTVLYIGVTNNLSARLNQHINGIGNIFTSKYKAYFLIYLEHYDFIDQAIAREKQLKGWDRSKKEELIKTKNPEWTFLNNDWL
ncbi:MAG TPA: GIY-YIG nuclease family protein [Chitinophagaceae bacterium]|nr:GIY-YIG nuclease family protein [Chitinophagaceae bacterium]HNN31961.1 GIY-YIG nuclease family protein [Chitinophagaceae bacterium]